MPFHKVLPEVKMPWPSASLQPMGMLTLVSWLLGLAGFAMASCFSTAIAFSLLITFAAIIITVYKLETEPYTLLTIHCMTSCLLLLDTPTTLFLIVAVVAAIMALGSCEVPTDRMAVFLISTTLSTALKPIPAIVACLLMATVLVVLRLRPFQLSTLALLGLHVLAVAVLVDRWLAAIVSLTFVGVIITGALVFKFQGHKNHGMMMLYDPNTNTNANNYNNAINHSNYSNHSPSPSHLHNGCLQLSSPTDSLDLQGHTVTSALQALHQFLTTHEKVYSQNRSGHTRHLKVITGEGGFHASQEMVNLIKPTVANFLKINKYRFDVSRESQGILIIDLESHAL